jgi:hypothetical protein
MRKGYMGISLDISVDMGAVLMAGLTRSKEGKQFPG